MRIITGSAKGLLLKAPRGMNTRPTTDRVKESLFSILGDIVVDAKVLDIFAGTGNLGLEALSRGANHAVFVDQSRESIAVIQENALHTRLNDQSTIIKADVVRQLRQLSLTNHSFDLVFCDPPYNKGYVQQVLEILDSSSLLLPQAIVVIEHSQHETIAPTWNHLEVRRSERYGETLITFLLYKKQQEVS